MLLTQEDRLNKDLHLQMLFTTAKGIPPRRTRGRKARSLKMGSCALQKVTASNYFFDVFCRTLILKSLNKGGVRPGDDVSLFGYVVPHYCSLNLEIKPRAVGAGLVFLENPLPGDAPATVGKQQCGKASQGR